jgi:hypothetical protein
MLGAAKRVPDKALALYFSGAMVIINTQALASALLMVRSLRSGCGAAGYLARWPGARCMIAILLKWAVPCAFWIGTAFAWGYADKQAYFAIASEGVDFGVFDFDRPPQPPGFFRSGGFDGFSHVIGALPQNRLCHSLGQALIETKKRALKFTSAANIELEFFHNDLLDNG